MIDHKLASAGEELRESLFPVRSLEQVILGDDLPRELAQLSAQLVLKPRQFLFLHEKRRSRREPLLVRHHRMVLDTAAGFLGHASTSRLDSTSDSTRSYSRRRAMAAFSSRLP